MLSNNSSVKLNFSVVGGTEEPVNPTENMIWINTDAEITKVVFRSVKPSNPVEGMVCIYTGVNSNAPFDRVVINGIGIDEVYPLNFEKINRTVKSVKVYNDAAITVDLKL